MTRITNKQPDTTDGAAFAPSNRPPAAQLTEAFNNLFAEYDRINGQRGNAASELATFNQNWRALAEEARKADGRATAESARGGTGVVVTDATEALTTKRKQLEETIAALTEALPYIREDLAQQRTKEQGRIAGYRKTEDKARAELNELLAKIPAAAQAVTTAIATREWIETHKPWEDNVLIDVTEIWAPANRNFGTAHDNTRQVPVQLSAVLTALANL